MMRTIAVGENDPQKSRVFFDVTLLDGQSPALLETSGQPQISINANAWTTNNIGVLFSLGFGRYYAQLGLGALTTAGDIILTRYASGSTLESRGDSFEVIDSTFIAASENQSLVSYYGDLVNANIFFSRRLINASWTGATPDLQTRALTQATQIIDRLNYAGDKFDPTQVQQFPRRDDFVQNDQTVDSIFDVTVPEDICLATYLTAYALLDGWDADIEANNARKLSDRFSSAGASYNPTFIQEWIKAGIPNQTVWSYLRPYLRDPLSISFVRG
jgi:hypothetical protein